MVATATHCCEDLVPNEPLNFKPVLSRGRQLPPLVLSMADLLKTVNGKVFEYVVSGALFRRRAECRPKLPSCPSHSPQEPACHDHCDDAPKTAQRRAGAPECHCHGIVKARGADG
jgi:hypothetical protein